jgi:hypothetical protein
MVTVTWAEIFFITIWHQRTESHILTHKEGIGLTTGGLTRWYSLMEPN